MGLVFAWISSDLGGNLPVLILVLLVNAAHEGSRGRQNLVDEDEDGLLGRQLDALADHIDELADGEICGYQILLLVDGSDIRLLDLFANNLQEMLAFQNVNNGKTNSERLRCCRCDKARRRHDSDSAGGGGDKR